MKNLNPVVEMVDAAGNAIGHDVLPAGDTLPGNVVQLSTDPHNRLKQGADGGLFALEQISTDPANVMTRGADGGLFVPPANLPYFRWELSNTGQANGGLGIDMGSWYRLDMRIGGNGTLPVQFDANGYALLPLGVYVAFSSAHVTSQPNAGAQVETWHASLMDGTDWGYPGVYQYDTMFFKRLDAQAEEFTMALSGVMANDHAAKQWSFGFDKTNTHTVRPQGYFGLLKIG
ncbi:hypothetical protein BGV68_01925 [Burkholderia ubonensis]|uniref:hypothetical protein n=1 Tax=Burkholderia ubonensis TaxID=101571 RepID=UPI0009168403|nr:hypothetical protein [Burkholderia ubonensis]OJA63804.1 hypothetical protein BGV68_01925 [Burkholderia ubonensis]